METVKIAGGSRAGVGTKFSKLDRAAGNVPCTIYGGGDNINCTVTPKSVKTLIYTPDFKVAEIEIDGKSHRCILKDVQFHPVKDTIMHIDFLRLVAGTAVKLEVPVRCVGASPGVKTGGKLMQKMRTVRIKTTPENMVDHLTVDVSSLELGDSVRVRDITLPENVQLMNPMANPIASVEIPRALRSATSAADGKEEGGEEAAAEE